jgi:hypothetical protein
MQFRGWILIHRSPRKNYNRKLVKYVEPLSRIARYLAGMLEELPDHLKRFILT